MRHRVYGKHLGRDKNQRTLLFRGLVESLLLHESINTTQTKATAIKGLVDKLITAQKLGKVGSKLIEATVVKKSVSDKLKEIAKSTKKTSGFTQIIKLGKRPGDGAMIVKMNLALDDGKRQPQAKPEIAEIKEEDD